MKRLNKLFATMACALALAVSVTSCGAFGKDDFFGTWCTSYTVTPSTVNTDAGYSWGAQAGKTDVSSHPNVKVYMYFDGSAENLVTGGGAKFYQYKIRYNDNKQVGVRTFWCGTYKLTDNSKYTEGKLTLNYLYGGTISEARLSDAVDAALSDDQASVASLLTSSSSPDVEVFDFALTGADLFRGYTQMSATARSGCTWEVANRSFELQGNDSDYEYLLYALDGDTDASNMAAQNVIFASDEPAEK